MKLIVKQSGPNQALVIDQKNNKILLTIDETWNSEKISNFVITLVQNVNRLDQLEITYDDGGFKDDGFWTYVRSLVNHWLVNNN